MRYTAILLLFFITVNSFGQRDKKKNYFPIWTYHQDSINVQGISLGLGSVRGEPRHTNTNGIKLELIGAGIAVPLIPQSPIAKNDTEFLELQQDPLSERINGLSLSSSGTVCDCLTNGLSAGLVGQINFQVNGISTSVFMNFSQRHNGIMAAFFNDAFYMNGLQLGVSSHGFKTKGIQLAMIRNTAQEMRGVQIGLTNKSDDFRGIQIGLWNVNQKRKLPFVNWNFERDKGKSKKRSANGVT